MDAFIGISNWIDVVFLGQTLFFHADGLTKPKGSSSFKILVDWLTHFQIQ
jgi:hypothetical protein